MINWGNLKHAIVPLDRKALVVELPTGLHGAVTPGHRGTAHHGADDLDVTGPTGNRWAWEVVSVEIAAGRAIAYCPGDDRCDYHRSFRNGPLANDQL